VLEQTIDTLSKGYKRRVGLAQAILHDPEILIMDEPTDGLDPNQKHEVRELIKEMAPNKGIIISTHILEEVDAVCTRAAIIARGRLLFSGTPAELEARSRYHNAVTLTVDPSQAVAIANGLQAMPEVADVEDAGSGTSVTRLTVLPHDGCAIFGKVQDACRHQAWRVHEMFVESGHLDEVFRTITSNHLAHEEAQRS
jgi:ABC-2 type transport system ATP-binding protein